ncbi:MULTISPECIES: hypothetical protein [Candidatus Williamhamiltonella]|uniref:Uncharacterized protein n=1 Tax=Candidatus Williamhamiltonella defendens TaxID=138072 RepID=A0A2D3TD59_9ENTR|nr:hypothetical protein [Candidatus Hamiltonella defensa]ATW33643.1 hypothetical protein BJP43_04380 [Candidatus Hamiltonella defensa]
MDSKEQVKKLQKELTQTRALLSNTVDTLQEERLLASTTKNRVVGGYYMMSRQAEKNLRALQGKNPAASLVFSVLREPIFICSNSRPASRRA